MRAFHRDDKAKDDDEDDEDDEDDKDDKDDKGTRVLDPQSRESVAAT